MSKTLFENLLKAFKRANKVRKIKLATDAGYPTIEAYEAFLVLSISGIENPASYIPAKRMESESTPTVQETTVIPVIHVVDIIDCSGSMSGDKIKAANEGIKQGFKELKGSNKHVKYTYTLCDFSDYNDIRIPYLLEDISLMQSTLSFSSRNMTALYDAIGKTLTSVLKSTSKEDKILVNIYTDGGENNSRIWLSSAISELIESNKDRCTVTFIGTKPDVATVVSKLKIEESNTLVYDGSAQGLAKSLVDNNISRSIYADKVSAGEDVSTGFYKTFNNK